MAAFEREEIEKLLLTLEKQGALFSEFSFVREETALKILGTGGFSVVYEMTSRNNDQAHYALKVMGLQPHLCSVEGFRDTAKAQRLLMEQTDYVVRILAVKNLWIRLTEAGEICGLWENDPPENAETCLHLQLMLMDKLERILARNRLGKITLQLEALTKEEEVLKLGLQVGQALLCAHKNQILHRDIKPENIFWDPRENCYKLGDFGTAKFTQDGSAETLVYSNGYGAPEIQRVLTENYDASADIYALGITLYVLLNNLKFPGSDGYHYREIQYHPDFTFPAPENASEAVASVLRKMCAYYKKDRYSSMTEVLAALTAAGEIHAEQWQDSAWIDLPTETYREETTDSENQPEDKEESRAARILKERAEARTVRKENAFFLPAFAVVFYFLLGTFTKNMLLSQWQFWLIPAALLLEAVFLPVKGLRIPAGIIAVGMMIASGVGTGFSWLHILSLVYMLGGLRIPLFSLAAAVLFRAFLPPEQLGLTAPVQPNTGWLLLILLLAMSHRLTVCPRDLKEGKPTAYRRGYYLITWLPLLLTGIGIFFWLRQQFWDLPMPGMLQPVHPIRTGLCGFALYVVQSMLWGEKEETKAEEEGTE